MSARIFEHGRRTLVEAHPGIPPFVCIEDKEHTVRCCIAIRDRRRREAVAEIVGKVTAR